MATCTGPNGVETTAPVYVEGLGSGLGFGLGFGLLDCVGFELGLGCVVLPEEPGFVDACADPPPDPPRGSLLHPSASLQSVQAQPRPP